MSSASDLFSSPPLAELLRPKTIGEIVSQPHSMILWRSPGVGKTTLARLFADGVHRRRKFLKNHIKQQLINVFVQSFVFPHCSVGVKGV